MLKTFASLVLRLCRISGFSVTLLIVAVMMICGDHIAEAQLPTIGSVERIDSRLNLIVPSDAEMEVLAEGHEWTEGPVWVPALQGVLYSDIPNNAIYLWREGGPASLWLQPSGYTGETPR